MLRTLVVISFVCAPLAAQEAQTSLVRVYGVGGLAPRAARAVGPEEWPHQQALSPLGARTGREIHDWSLPSEPTPKRGRRPRVNDVTARAVAELVKPFAASVAVAQSGEHLIVSATLEQHKDIAKIIEALHRGGGDFEIEVRHVALPATEASRALVADASAGRIDEGFFKKLAAADEHKSRRVGTLRATQGGWAVFRAVRERRYVPDYEVEIAQGASIADPVSHTAVEGVKAAVRPFMLRDGRVLLRVVASGGDITKIESVSLGANERSDTLRLRNTDYGNVERADYVGCVASTEMIVATGRWAAVVAGTTATRFDLLLFRVTTAPEPVRAGTFMALPTGALTADDRGWRLGTAFNGEPVLREAPSAAWMHLSTLKERLWEALGDDDTSSLHDAFWLHGGSLILNARGRKVVPVLDTLAALERAFLKPVRVDIRLTSGGVPLGRVGGPAVAERIAVFAGYRRIDYVGDYDVEIAQESRIADPNPHAAYGGVVANLRAFRTGTNTYRLQLDLRVAALAAEVRTFMPGTGGIPGIQSVPLRKSTTRLTFEIAAGQEKTVTLGENPFGDGILKAVVSLHDR